MVGRGGSEQERSSRPANEGPFDVLFLLPSISPVSPLPSTLPRPPNRAPRALQILRLAATLRPSIKPVALQPDVGPCVRPLRRAVPGPHQPVGASHSSRRRHLACRERMPLRVVSSPSAILDLFSRPSAPPPPPPTHPLGALLPPLSSPSPAPLSIRPSAPPAVDSTTPRVNTILPPSSLARLRPSALVRRTQPPKSHSPLLARRAPPVRGVPAPPSPSAPRRSSGGVRLALAERFGEVLRVFDGVWDAERWRGAGVGEWEARGDGELLTTRSGFAEGGRRSWAGTNPSTTIHAVPGFAYLM